MKYQEQQLLEAKFEHYCNTTKPDGKEGAIFVNSDPSSPFSGEVIDLFEDGSFDHYSQFKNQKLNFKFK